MTIDEVASHAPMIPAASLSYATCMVCPSAGVKKSRKIEEFQSSVCLDLLTWSSEVDKFFKSSQSATSRSPDHPPLVRKT